MPGVHRCVVGYSGGRESNPTYHSIQDYTEALLIEYDPAMVSYNDILKKWKELVGMPYPASTQYRSAIMCLNPEQMAQAREFCSGMKHVQVEPATEFYRAEEYHQNFIKKQTAMY